MRADAPVNPEPLDDPVKAQGHPRCTRRGRPDLHAYYSDQGNRFRGLSAAAVRRLLDVQISRPPVLHTDMGPWVKFLAVLGHASANVLTWASGRVNVILTFNAARIRICST